MHSSLLKGLLALSLSATGLVASVSAKPIVTHKSSNSLTRPSTSPTPCETITKVITTGTLIIHGTSTLTIGNNQEDTIKTSSTTPSPSPSRQPPPDRQPSVPKDGVSNQPQPDTRATSPTAPSPRDSPSHSPSRQPNGGGASPTAGTTTKTTTSDLVAKPPPNPDGGDASSQAPKGPGPSKARPVPVSAKPHQEPSPKPHQGLSQKPSKSTRQPMLPGVMVTPGVVTLTGSSGSLTTMTTGLVTITEPGLPPGVVVSPGTVTVTNPAGVTTVTPGMVTSTDSDSRLSRSPASVITMSTGLITMIPATGAVASSSAMAFSSDLVGIFPLISSWIRNPDPPAATAALKALKDIGPPAEHLKEELGGSSSGVSSGGCGSSLFALLGCITDKTKDIAKSIEDSIKIPDPEDDVKDVENDMDDLKPHLDKLPDLLPDNPGDEPPDDEPSKTASETDSTSTSTETTTSTSASSSTSTATPTYVCSPQCSACMDSKAVPIGLQGSPLLHSKRDLLPSVDSFSNDTNTLQKRVLEFSTDTFFSFFLDALQTSQQLNHEAEVLLPGFQASDDNNAGMTSALMHSLYNEKASFSVVNLYGCTSLVLVSKFGIYMSHFFEVPSFRQQVTRTDQYGNQYTALEFNQELFTNDVLNVLESGLAMSYTSTRIPPIQVPLFTRPDAETQAIIFTPLSRDRPGMKYPDEVGQIQNKVAELLNVQAAVYPYVNMGQADPRIPRPEYVQDMEWTYGKVIVQYDPQDGMVSETMPDGSTCQGIQAGLQVLAGDKQDGPVLKKNWLAELDQIDLTSLNMKRDNVPMCSKDVYPSGPARAPTGMPPGGAGGSGSTFKTSAASNRAKPTKGSSGHLSGPVPSCQRSSDCTDYCGSEGPGCANGKCICDPGASMLPTSSTRSFSATKTPASITPGPSPGLSGGAQNGEPLCVNSQDPDISGISCVCSTKSFGQDIATSFALPYTAGTQTVSDQCNEITEYPSTNYASTTTPAPYTPPIVHDYTSKDANQNLVVFASASVQYGAVDIGGTSAMQVAETYGIGTPTATITHTPTPTAACGYWNWVFGDTFVIYHIEDWKGQDQELATDEKEDPGSDDLSDLFDRLKSSIEAHNCGAVTRWDTDNNVPGYGPAVKFNLGIDQATCVDHAIQGAGGPPEGCRSAGTQGWDTLNSVADTLADHYPEY